MSICIILLFKQNLSKTSESVCFLYWQIAWLLQVGFKNVYIILTSKKKMQQHHVMVSTLDLENMQLHVKFITYKRHLRKNTS